MAYHFAEGESQIPPQTTTEKAQSAPQSWETQAMHLRRIIASGRTKDNMPLSPNQIHNREIELAKLEACIGLGTSRRYEERGLTPLGQPIVGRVRPSRLAELDMAS